MTFISGNLSNEFLLHYHNQLAWFSIENVLVDNVTIGSGVTGVGFVYFTTPDPKGFFLTGTVGWPTGMHHSRTDSTHGRAWELPGV